MRAKVASSIYWDSVDSGSGSSGSAGSRNYVDPWDLENYAYLRRNSVAAAAVTPQPIYQRTSRNGYSSRSSHHSPESDYWYGPTAIREPGYDAPASVEEIYFRPAAPAAPAPVQHQQYRSVSSNCYYHQPIYEDEMSHYAAPMSLYAHLSEIEQDALDELRTREMLRRRSKTARSRNYAREECYYHSRRRPSEMMMLEAPSRYVEDDIIDEEEVDTVRYSGTLKPPATHISLNTYGHLKIDYTNSWNSLHRKIASK